MEKTGAMRMRFSCVEAYTAYATRRRDRSERATRRRRSTSGEREERSREPRSGSRPVVVVESIDTRDV